MALRQEVESFLLALGRQQRWQEVLQLLEMKRTGEWPVGHLEERHSTFSEPLRSS